MMDGNRTLVSETSGSLSGTPALVFLKTPGTINSLETNKAEQVNKTFDFEVNSCDGKKTHHLESKATSRPFLSSGKNRIQLPWCSQSNGYEMIIPSQETDQQHARGTGLSH